MTGSSKPLSTNSQPEHIGEANSFFNNLADRLGPVQLAEAMSHLRSRTAEYLAHQHQMAGEQYEEAQHKLSTIGKLRDQLG